MDARDSTNSVLEWDEDAVIAWLTSIGFPQYAPQIREHNISGDVLTNLDQDTLKEVGVQTIGQRLAILKAVYYLKLSHNVPIDTDHYVPPSEIEDDHDGVTLESLHEIVKEQADRLRQLEYENKLLQSDLRVCLDELGSNVKTTAAQARVRVRSAHQMAGELTYFSQLPLEEKPLNRQSSFKWASYVTPARSPTRIAMESDIESPRVSPSAPEHDILHNSIPALKPIREAPPPPDRAPSRLQQPPVTPNSFINGSSSSSSGISNTNTLTPTPPSNTPASKPTRSESNEGLKDGLKSFKVSLEDPAWKVLPAALKKYKINNDDWQNYAMFICYGNTERCLSYDEKPLLLFQRLKDAKKNPVFMLKHIRDIRSPIVVAQQKQAARQMAKASEAAAAASASTPTTATLNASKTQRMTGLSRQQSLRTAAVRDTPQTAGASATSSTAWPASDTMSPSMEPKQEEDRTSPGDEDGTVIGKDIIPAPKDISYAVAIYPYMAEQEDEFDVVVGDTFIILQRARGWWVVQRDPSGSGIVENDPSKQGWVPAGCLLETSVPVASAVAEATGGNTTADGKPILPLSIISTSFPGIALMDYTKKGDEELDLKKDDVLRVFKRYNHWSYVSFFFDAASSFGTDFSLQSQAVKEEGGARGWVPSWFIGKVAGVGVPSTPNTSNSGNMQGMQMTTSMLDPDIRYASEGGIQSSESISPVSPGFPPASALRTTTVV
ncbi:hypothetical protein Clacol_005312 [Clathrus columnatus]|uniref:Uncharacterized protein n=1 Tax=Clathrus columnatus TaxID=1419009 RepID=A0AAV5ADK1_9AGAM|nr:hypothetical protein Clacol_005312 [Clathrus columnatus]